MPLYIPDDNNIQTNFYDRLEKYLDRESTIQIKRVSSDYSATFADYAIWVDTGSARTITLPAVTAVPVGKVYIIKDKTGSAGTNTITILPAVDGSSLTITSNFGYVWVQNEGTTYGQIG